MSESIEDSPARRLDWSTPWAVGLIAAAVLAADYVSGRHVRFPMLYVLPVGLLAWRESRRAAHTMAILLPAARLGFCFLWGESEALGIELVNATIQAVSLALYAHLIGVISDQRKRLETKVTALEGILPICASCRRIKRSDGEYEQIEAYITKNTEVLFSHGLCPECLRRLYPEDAKALGV